MSSQASTNSVWAARPVVPLPQRLRIAGQQGNCQLGDAPCPLGVLSDLGSHRQSAEHAPQQPQYVFGVRRRQAGPGKTADPDLLGPDASLLRHTANIVGEGPKLVSRDDEVERDQKIFTVEECLCIVACSLEETVIFDSLTRGNGRLLQGCRKNLLQAGGD